MDPQQQVAITPDPVPITPDPPTNNAPGTVTGSIATIGAARNPLPPRTYPAGEGEGFIDRMTERFGSNLRNTAQAVMHPLDTISAMLSSRTSPVDALSEQYQKDHANLAGDVMTAAMGKAVTGSPPGINMADAGASKFVPEGIAHPMQAIQRGAAALQPNLVDLVKKPISSTLMAAPKAIKAALGDDIQVLPVNRPAPLWKQAGIEPTQPGFNWQTSSPEEIQAQMNKMAQNAANRPAMHAEKAPAPNPSSDYQVVQIPAGKTAQAVGPAYSSPRTPVTMEVPSGGGSSTIQLHGYHPESQTMTVQFKNGNVYELRGVPPEIYQNYQNAESQGSFYQQNLKGRYDTRLVGKVGKPSAGAQVRQALGGQ